MNTVYLQCRLTQSQGSRLKDDLIDVSHNVTSHSGMLVLAAH